MRPDAKRLTHCIYVLLPSVKHIVVSFSPTEEAYTPPEASFDAFGCCRVCIKCSCVSCNASTLTPKEKKVLAHSFLVNQCLDPIRTGEPSDVYCSSFPKQSPIAC